MKHSEQEKLLKEILPGEDIGEFERASLERGLTRMRQNRRGRYLVRAGALAALAIAMTLVIRSSLERPNPGSFASSELQPVSQAKDSLKLVSDDELLAMFPGRSVALIGKPGQQRLVFLDKPASDSGKANF